MKLENFEKSNLNYKILNKVNNKKLPEFYNKSYVYLNTSLYEGNPKSILEAMAWFKYSNN